MTVCLSINPYINLSFVCQLIHPSIIIMAFYNIIVAYYQKVLTMKELLQIYPFKVVASLYIHKILTVSHMWEVK